MKNNISIKKIAFGCMIILSSCSADKTKDKNIEIVIEDAHSYKYDFKKEIYTVFYMSKPATEIKFHLSNEERNRIIDTYYSLKMDKIEGINKITGNILIEDECLIMPKLYTILHIKTKKSLQEIQIDTGCDNFYLSNFIKANRIKKFIQFIIDIIRSKQEVKNAPKSDIWYI